MTNQEIYDLMDRFQKTKLSRIKLSIEDFTIELEQGSAAPAAAPAAVVQTAAPAAETAAPKCEAPAITAPLVGTFYAAPAPDQPPFVTVGDRVSKGQTVCLMEAMKMMSEIPAPCDLIVEAVMKADGELAAFGEPLFRYRAV